MVEYTAFLIRDALILHSSQVDSVVRSLSAVTQSLQAAHVGTGPCDISNPSEGVRRGALAVRDAQVSDLQIRGVVHGDLELHAADAMAVHITAKQLDQHMR